jgi:hypothetical protein
MDAIRKIGSRLEPLLDDWLIERMDGVQLRLHQPVLREVAFSFDQPWEGPVSFGTAVRLDGDRTSHREGGICSYSNC